MWPLNKEWWGQHSQFLLCFDNSVTPTNWIYLPSWWTQLRACPAVDMLEIFDFIILIIIYPAVRHSRHAGNGMVSRPRVPAHESNQTDRQQWCKRTNAIQGHLQYFLTPSDWVQIEGWEKTFQKYRQTVIQTNKCIHWKLSVISLKKYPHYKIDKYFAHF